MIPVIERYDYQEFFLDGLHFMLFSHEDLGEVIKASPYKLFSNSGNLSGWVIDHPKREDDIEGGFYDNEFDWETAF